MKRGKRYIAYFKNNMFLRILLLFSCIAILSIITIAYVTYVSISQSIVRRELDTQKAAMESVDRYIHLRHESVQNMVRDMYRNEALSMNVSFFMDHAYSEYVQHRMDEMYMESHDYSTDVLTYFKNWLDENRDISNLILYSADQQYLSTFNENKQFKQFPVHVARSFVPDVMAAESKSVSAPNYWIRKAVDQWSPSLYSLQVPINNKQTLKNTGQLLVFLNSKNISNALTSYGNNLKGEIIVLSTHGTVLFDSRNNYYGKTYPYVEVTRSLYDDVDSDVGIIQAKQNMYINKLISPDEGYVVIGAVPNEEMAESYRGIRNTILTISVVCILFAVLFPAFFVINFAKRTNRIIKFTRQVKNGDLTARIQDPQEDELGQISRSFNDMLDELNLYIERVYKAEIKQKQTELVALQARIHPHFLYNTLEVIRMRAISQGAKDVGEMIYSLSVLFKSLVQQKKIYTLKDELEACRLYLELFRIRYKERFDYTITVDPELYPRSVMKLMLQPIIENYIVHGIQSDRNDNVLTIDVREVGEVLLVEIRDNGKGIEGERLKEILAELERSEENGQMFGLRSVHTRLRFLYGADYGIELESLIGEGTTIRVRCPNREGMDAIYV
ncbi:histidine kinase [Paenibacillus terrae HPL-003]|uniref:histidine kinase n=1 Tax=Paenibacillus terrae (strain HPL-003) TaxID=985665 RepID=G7VT43_PAETH|nr:sensor histidine kinase [Paenibacillus terrae]AET57458.1 histidine kinase [Paenibacillus terrae HPL-003]